MHEKLNSPPKKAVHDITNLIQNKKLDEACDLGEHYQQKYPDNEYVLTALAKAYLEKSRIDKHYAPQAIRNARTLLCRVCLLSPDNNVAATLLSVMALREQNYQSAKDFIEPVFLREKPPNVRVMGIYCTVLAALQKPQDVLQVADEMIRIEPTNGNGFRFKAEALLAMNQPMDAMKSAKVALLLSPNDQRMTTIMKTIQGYIYNAPTASKKPEEEQKMDATVKGKRSKTLRLNSRTR